MLDEVLGALAPCPGEFALDCTLGFGGHAQAILERIAPTGKLVGLDWDLEQLKGSEVLLVRTGVSHVVHHANFASAASILAGEGMSGVDILIADLGMSSMQVDDPERGFSYVRDGPLDMRMDRSRGRTAAQVLATIPEDELSSALLRFGDEPRARDVARALVVARAQQPILRTSDLSRVVAALSGEPSTREEGWRLRPTRRQWQAHPAARTFQALRILVNRELANLQELLRTLPQVLKPGGRAAFISFHSGEDRLVKTAFRKHAEKGWLAEIALQPVRPSEEEKLSNPRSRSAKLRWARRSDRKYAE
jgi:16S rRNA (cytosine1402-N4)-methyltransferase